MAPFTPLYINGQPRPSSTHETFEVRNPYTNEVVGISASASSQDCKDAIDAAGKAFLTWEHTPVATKRDIFLKAAEIVFRDEFKAKIVAATTEETGATAAWGVNNNWGPVRNFLRHAAGAASELRGHSFPSGGVPGANVITQRRAMGVILAIAPWNAPFFLSIRAIAIPLMCGNTVILKSSEYSPRTQSLVFELFHEAGLPDGVLNYISLSRESSPALTAEMIAHPLVRKINFTGSDRVGKILASEAAKYLKPCVLELGGKAPSVVLNDANITEASKAIVFGSMIHSGQVCMSTERVIVQRQISESLMASVATLCESLKTGDPREESTHLPPLFTQGSADNVLSMIREAREGGAEVFLGDLTQEGAVMKPHLLKGVQPGMRIWDRETFGPVVVFAVVDTIDEAVDLANRSEYSLSASLWTTDVHQAMQVAPRIRSGYVNINGPTIHSEVMFGLMGLGGASGYGRFGVEDFTDERLVVLHPPQRVYPLTT